MKRKIAVVAVVACALALAFWLGYALQAPDGDASPPDVASLAEALVNAPEESVRADAAYGLLRAAARDAAAVRNDPTCMRRLLAALTDSSGRVRVLAISAINRAIGVRFHYAAEAAAARRGEQAAAIASYLSQRGLL